MKSIIPTTSATRLTTYRELIQFAKAFGKGQLGFVIVIGRGGIGKSETFRKYASKSAVWVTGNTSGPGIYQQAFEHLDEPLMLDDVAALYGKPDEVHVLKALCETKAVKKVSWTKDRDSLRRRGIPTSFETSSPVALIANRWDVTNADVAALQTRGDTLYFDPPALEIHRYAGTWFWDQEIFDFIGERLQFVKNLSLRLYVLASERKAAGLPWKSLILDQCFSGARRVVAELKADKSIKTEEDRVRRFIQRTGKSRATYFNHAKKLQPCGKAPMIRLKHAAPPVAARNARGRAIHDASSSVRTRRKTSQPAKAARGKSARRAA